MVLDGVTVDAILLLLAAYNLAELKDVFTYMCVYNIYETQTNLSILGCTRYYTTKVGQDFSAGALLKTGCASARITNRQRRQTHAAKMQQQRQQTSLHRLRVIAKQIRCC